MPRRVAHKTKRKYMDRLLKSSRCVYLIIGDKDKVAKGYSILKRKMIEGLILMLIFKSMLVRNFGRTKPKLDFLMHNHKTQFIYHST